MYAVTWKKVVLDHLADLYVAADASTRDRMAAGVEALNHQLAADPHAVGEDRAGGFRIAFPPLLAVTFHVNDQTRAVRVTGISRYGR